MFNNFLKQKHNGFGGVYFLIVSFILSSILILCFRTSWASQVVAMSDNLAYIATINAAVHCFTENLGYYEGPDTGIIIDDSYKGPLSDFNQMLENAKIAVTSTPPNYCNDCYVIWDGDKKIATIQFGKFKTFLNLEVRPHEQQAVIELY